MGQVGVRPSDGGRGAKVDFDAVPKAVDHLRSAIVVNAINAVGKAYTRFGQEEKETYRDEMQLCAAGEDVRVSVGKPPGS